MTTNYTEYRVTLRTVPRAGPAELRLRRALKVLLRAFGLKCVSVEEVPPPSDPAPAAPPAPDPAPSRPGVQ